MHVSVQLITKTHEEVATAHIIVMNGHTFLNKCPKMIYLGGGGGGGGGEQNLWPKLFLLLAGQIWKYQRFPLDTMPIRQVFGCC